MNFKAFCCNLKIKSLRKKLGEAFFQLYFVFEIFHFKQNSITVFHMKRPYWMQLIVRKESLNCVTQFSNHLWLIQGLVCLAFKNYWLLNLRLAEIQTGHIFNIIFWGTKLISELVHFESKLPFYWPTKVEVPFSQKKWSYF